MAKGLSKVSKASKGVSKGVSNTLGLNRLCKPAMIYLVLSIVLQALGLIFILRTRKFTSSSVKDMFMESFKPGAIIINIIVLLLWVYGINFLCSRNLTWLAYLINVPLALVVAGSVVGIMYMIINRLEQTVGEQIMNVQEKTGNVVGGVRDKLSGMMGQEDY